MIVSDKKKFIMFCPPKTGSTTLTHRLLAYDSRDNFYYQPRWNEEKFKLEELKHLTYGEFLAYEDSKLLDRYFSFCFVRNPYDRLYSGFLMRCHHIKNVRHPRLPENKEYLNKLCRYLEKQLFGFNASLELLCQLEDVGFLRLTDYTHHEGCQVLDFVGYNERYEEDYQTVCDNLDVVGEATPNKVVRKNPMPPCNPCDMQRTDYKYIDKYERRTIAFVNDRYAQEFDAFGYRKFDPKDFPERVEYDTEFELFQVKAPT